MHCVAQRLPEPAVMRDDVALIVNVVRSVLPHERQRAGRASRALRTNLSLLATLGFVGPNPSLIEPNLQFIRLPGDVGVARDLALQLSSRCERRIDRHRNSHASVPDFIQHASYLSSHGESQGASGLVSGKHLRRNLRQRWHRSVREPQENNFSCR